MKLPEAVEKAIESGWSIMPMRANKRPFLPEWKWLQSERPARELIEGWQKKFNPPAWAVITGRISGIFVTDHDEYAEGAITLAHLGLAGKENVITGSGGKHVYWLYPGYHVPTLNSKSAKKVSAAGFFGFDIRGDGGYALFAGRNENGPYKWVQPIDEDLRPEMLPQALRDALDFHPPAAPTGSPGEPPPVIGAPAKPPTPPAAPKGTARKKPLREWALEEALKRQGDGRNAAGFWLAQQLRDNSISQSEAESFLLAEYLPRVKPTNTKGQAEPYTAEEARATVRQAYSRAPREPLVTKAEQAAREREERDRAARAAADRAAAGARAPAPAEPSDSGPAPEPPEPPAGNGNDEEPGRRQAGAHKCKYTDLGNAERLLMRYRGNIRYCKLMAKWFIWDGRRMRMDDTGEIDWYASRTARALWQEIQYAENDGDREARIKHARLSEGEARMNAMVSRAESLRGVPIRSRDIDAHPWLLNVWNGTLDLKTQQLRPHRREDLITKVIPHSYIAGEKCPNWLKFLNLIMDGNQNLIEYLQMCVGYCLSGDISERVLFVPWGSGANGKSTFLIAIQELLGEYAMKTPSSTLVSRREGTIPNDIARLQGARFVYASETKEGGKLSEDTVKELTGGEPLTARFMRGEFFEFLPNFKLWLATNHRPRIDGTDLGIWDRIKLIPFIVRIPDVVPEDQAISRETALQQFRDEAAGILAWAVEGCARYLRAGRIADPPEVKAATQAYREDMDTLAHFLAEYTQQTTSADFYVRSSVLYECFTEWAKANGEYVVSQKVFSNRILERGFIRTRKNEGQVYLNLRLIKQPCRVVYDREPKNGIDEYTAPRMEGMPESDTQPYTTLHEGDGIEI